MRSGLFGSVAHPSAARRRLSGAVLVVAVLGGLMASSTAAFAANASPAGFRTNHGAGGESDVNVCSTATAPGYVHCLAHLRTDSRARQESPARPGHATSATTIGNNGAYDPAYLQSAYNVLASGGATQTVGIVDAFDDPNAEADMNAYRAFYGLPACTTVGGCFHKVNQSGAASPLPTANASWGEEISLDLDMVSAICPNCKILLVEASNTSIVSLGTSVNTAVSMGANAVSNSYGGPEYSSEVSDANTYYNHPGVAITVSSGDNGYGVEFPAAAGAVTAVGGTSLRQTTNTGTRTATEKAWTGAGSGCSAFVAKPSWQTDTGCTRRTVADVSAVADPNTGVWVYDTYGTGFTQAIFGGTSASSPIIASMYALADNAASTNTLSQYPYETRTALNDIILGSNGSCTPAYLCKGVAGYDGPTGLGTPNGTAAFAPPSGVVASPPNTPTLVAATSATKGITLSWSAPADNGAPITSYEVYRGKTTGSEVAFVAVNCTAATCTYNDSKPAAGLTAFYQLTAINSAGPSTKSAEVSAVAK